MEELQNEEWLDIGGRSGEEKEIVVCEAVDKSRRICVCEVDEIRARRRVVEIEWEEVGCGKWTTSVDVG